jgi:hypothetical protein
VNLDVSTVNVLLSIMLCSGVAIGSWMVKSIYRIDGKLDHISEQLNQHLRDHE